MSTPLRMLRLLAWRAMALPGTIAGLTAAAVTPAAATPASYPAPPPQHITRIFRHGLFWAVVILIILAVALIALRRFSFRYKQRLKARRKPADTSDVWPQHRLPPDWDEPPTGPAEDSRDVDKDS